MVQYIVKKLYLYFYIMKTGTNVVGFAELRKEILYSVKRSENLSPVGSFTKINGYEIGKNGVNSKRYTESRLSGNGRQTLYSNSLNDGTEVVVAVSSDKSRTRITFIAPEGKYFFNGNAEFSYNFIGGSSAMEDTEPMHAIMGANMPYRLLELDSDFSEVFLGTGPFFQELADFEGLKTPKVISDPV